MYSNCSASPHAFLDHSFDKNRLTPALQTLCFRNTVWGMCCAPNSSHGNLKKPIVLKTNIAIITHFVEALLLSHMDTRV